MYAIECFTKCGIDRNYLRVVVWTSLFLLTNHSSKTSKSPVSTSKVEMQYVDAPIRLPPFTTTDPMHRRLSWWSVKRDDSWRLNRFDGIPRWCDANDVTRCPTIMEFLVGFNVVPGGWNVILQSIYYVWLCIYIIWYILWPEWWRISPIQAV